MKVYNRVVMNMDTWEVLEEDSYYSDQEPAMCDFGTSVEAPAPAAKDQTQQDLESLQLEQLKKANLYSDLTTPVNLASAGYIEEKQADGTSKLRMMTPSERLASMDPLSQSLYKASLQQLQIDPTTGAKMTEEQALAGMTDSERRDYQLTKAYQERQQQALSGTLPVSPALEKQLADEETQLTNTLSMRLGPDWQLSTPGIKAMSDLKQRHELLREEARRGQISTGEALIASSENTPTPGAKQALTTGSYLDTLSGSTGNKLYSIPGMYSGMTQTTGNVIAPYQNERMTVYGNNVSAAMQSSANKAALYGSLIKGGASAYGSYMAYG